MRADPRQDLVRLLDGPIAHRGLHACGGAGPVENSIGAAAAAIAAGYGIECDVQLSRDGEAIVLHDDDLGRLTGASGRVADFDVATLRRLRLRGSADAPPTLPEFLTLIGGRVPLVVEIKSLGDGDMRLSDRVLSAIDGYGGPVALESFDPVIVLHCQGAKSNRPVGLVGPAESRIDPGPALVAACNFLSWSIDDLARIASLHPSLPLTTWTVRTPAQVALAKLCKAQIVFEGFEADR